MAMSYVDSEFFMVAALAERLTCRTIVIRGNLRSCVCCYCRYVASDGKGLKRNWFKFGGKFTHSLEPG